MRGLGFFRNLRVRSQLFIVYSCLFCLVLVVGGEIMLSSMQNAVEESISGDLGDAVADRRDAIYRPLQQQMRRIWNVAVGVSLALVLSLTFAASSRLARPLRRLVWRFELVAAGDLAAGTEEQGLGEDRSDASTWVGPGDEIAALSQALERIRGTLLSIIASAQVIAAGDLSRPATGEGDLADAFNQILSSLRQIVDQTRNAGMQINSAVAHMLAASSEQTSSATQQSGSISEVTSTMTELARTSKEVTNSSERVVEIAAQTQGDARSGVEAAKAALVAMDAIRETHEQSTKGVVSLADKVQQISEVMDIIDDIADNTKLIAFNAALEAAGAGESGRRFGVVAQEIRRLADTVVEATEDSPGRIEEIQEATNNMVVASERNSRVFEEGFSATQATADSLQKILGSASSTADSAKQISLSTQQERTAMQQILDAMVEVSEGATHFAGKVNETNEIASNLRGLAAELTELIGRYEVDEAADDPRSDESPA